MFAVIRTGGKQYKVKKDDRFCVETLEAEIGDEVNLDVLLLHDGKTTHVCAGGDSVVPSAQVTATVVDHVRGPKIVIFKKKRRQNYRRKKGHRQNLTLVQIKDLQITDTKTATA